MSTLSNFEYKGKKYENVEFKIVRIFGSKPEGWGATFAFVSAGEDFIEENYIGMFPLGISWADGNPYPALYQALEKFLSRNGFTPSNDILIEVEEVKPEVEEVKPQPKKIRKSKVKPNGKSDSSS